MCVRAQVLIPAEQNYHVEAWVYERSPQELKQAVQAAQRKRELGEVRSCGRCAGAGPLVHRLACVPWERMRQLLRGTGRRA